MLRQQQEAYYAERARLLDKESENGREITKDHDDKIREAKIYKLSCEIYGRNNDGRITSNPKNAIQTPMKIQCIPCLSARATFPSFN